MRRDIITQHFRWAFGPQLVALLVVSMLFVGAYGSISNHRLAAAAQNKVIARELKVRLAAAKRRATREAFQRELASTYSWISPVNCRIKRCIALTFDDGPDMYTTPEILSTLESEQIHASFFIVGSRVAGNQALLRRMRADGDEIGDHSWTHPDFTTLTVQQIHQQIALTQAAIEATGVPAPTLFRPPYGDVDQKVIDNIPLTIMFWNEDPQDWEATNPVQVEKAVEASAKPGGVVDMHDIYQTTAEALNPIIKKLKSEDFQFVTVSQLMGLKPGQRGEYYGYYSQ